MASDEKHNDLMVWTENDYRKGWCSRWDIGQLISGGSAAPEQSAPQQQPAGQNSQGEQSEIDAEIAKLGGNDRLLHLYRTDADGFAMKYPPGVTAKVLELDKVEKLEQSSQATSALDKEIEEIREDEYDRSLARILVAGLADDDAAKAARMREALGADDHLIFKMLSIAGDRLPEHLRVELGKHFFMPVSS